MRALIVIAALATGILMFGCNWLSSKTKTQKTFNIAGVWKLDSLLPGNDSSNNISWLNTVASTPPDSLNTINFVFANDTVVTNSGSINLDTSFYKLNDGKLIIRYNSKETTFITSPVSDSMIIIAGTDSTRLWLSR